MGGRDRGGGPAPVARRHRSALPRRRAIDEAEALGDALSVPVEMHDERLTTGDRRTTACASKACKGPRRTAVVDKVAAAVLLQAWLDDRRDRGAARPT